MDLPATRSRLELLIKAARLYYRECRKQEDIAAELRVSRATVSRLLDEARARGIVKIQISHPLERAIEVEHELESRLPGVRFHVSYPAGPSGLGLAVDQLAADLLRRELHSGQNVGVSTGTTMARVTAALMDCSPPPDKRPTFVQLVGAVAPENRMVDGPELCRQFALAFNSRFITLPAPLLARDRKAARVFRENDTIAEALSFGRDVDVALVGVGGVGHRTGCGDLLYGWTEPDTRRELASGGAACRILAQFLDAKGEPLTHEVNHRVVGLRLKELRAVPRVIGIVSGVGKHRAVMSALCGGYVDDLVMDMELAYKVLELLGEHHVRRPALHPQPA